MLRIAVVGGGPGGLMTAYHLFQKCYDEYELTIFEASGRLGGKIVSRRFDKAPVLYEAGVAELYDYSMIGPDPLRLLIEKLGLKTVEMDSNTVVLDHRILRNRAEIRQMCGKETLKAVDEFRKQLRAFMSPEDYYEGHWQDDNHNPLAKRSCQTLLDEVPDTLARKYLRIAAHSDLATEPHLTNALTGIKNFLMDVDGYIGLYSIEGGIERLPQALREQTRAKIELNSPVVRVERNADQTYRVFVRKDGQLETHDFDYVLVALPHNWLSSVEWGGEKLARAMQEHIAYYDKPAHYLRVTALFKKPFWRELITDSWWMSDAFNGCCVYDEGARHDAGGYGALGWLLAGTDAVTMSNFTDEELIRKALDSLPEQLRDGRELFLEGRVHRWLNSVNAVPGGFPVKEVKKSHVPEPKEHPGFFLVGDYLFDSTLNGVLDSSDFATDLLFSRLMKQRFLAAVAAYEDSHQAALAMTAAGSSAGATLMAESAKVSDNGLARSSPRTGKSGRIDREYFNRYHCEYTEKGIEEWNYEDSYDEYFNAEYVERLIKIVWKAKPPYRLLDAGSASGLTLADFAELGIDPWGIESNKYIHSQTPKEWRRRNKLGDVRKLPYRDNQFDFVYETCLGDVPERDVERAIRELHRVTRRGVLFTSLTSDMNPEILKRPNVFKGMKTLLTLWEWSELFLANGFRMEINDPKTLNQVWRTESKYNEGEGDWYPDEESMRYCFYTKVSNYED